MDEILQKLLSSELLSEDAKAEISTQWTNSVNEYKQAIREEVTVEVRAEIAEQWTSERETLVDSIDTFVSSKLQEEISELKADIERFRDLEAEYANKIVEEKHSMAEKLAEELEDLVDKMDAFFELRLSEEMEELKEDMEIVKQNEFGRRIFESFANEFSKSYINEDSVQAKLSVTEAKLLDAERAISELEESKAQMVREAKMEKILGSLNGKKREQMEFVLASVDTNRLEEAYNHFIGRILKENTDAPTNANNGKQTLSEAATVIATGDAAGQPTKQTTQTAQLDSIRKLAGIKPSRN